MNRQEIINPTLALTDALRDTYPGIPFEGVPAYRPYIAPVGDAPHLSDDDERFLVHLTKNINRTLMTSKDNFYFTGLLAPEQTDTAIIQAAQAVLSVAKNDESIHVVCPPAGAIPLARLLTNFGLPRARVHPVEISGSSGTTTGHATVKEQTVPDSVLDPDNTIIVFDDIGDTYTTIGRLSLLRAGAPCVDLVTSCANANILLFPVFSKNEKVLDSLLETTGLQRELARLITPIGNVWVVGAGLLDTGIYLSQLTRKPLPRFINPPDKNNKHNEWLLRIGPWVPGLAYLDTALHHEEYILDFAARELKNMLEGR